MTQPADFIFPVEIWDQVFGFLRADPNTLRSASAAHVFLKGVSERHLFHHINIYNNEQSEPGKFSPAQLSRLLQTSPHILAYVQSVRIVITSPGILRWFMTRSLNDEEIAAILPRLSQLRKVILTTRRSCRIAWSRLHESFRSSFLQTLQSEGFRDASVQGIDDFPLASLNKCFSLRRLSFSGIYEINNTDIHTDGPHPQLDFFSVQYCPYALATIIFWANSPSSSKTSHLKYLDFRTLRPEDLRHLPHVLHTCSSSLQHLELDLGKEFHSTCALHQGGATSPTPALPFELSQLFSLESLTIHTSISSSHEFWVSSTGEETQETHFYSTALPAISNLILTLPTLSLVKALSLVITFRVDVGSLSRVDWTPFQRAVSSLRLRNLKSVILRVSAPSSHQKAVKGRVPMETSIMGVLKEDEVLSKMHVEGLLDIMVERSHNGGVGDGSGITHSFL